MSARLIGAFLIAISMGAQAKGRLHPAKVGKASIKVEIAKTTAERSQGLMYRRSLGANEGMLFVFDREETQSFWMKNTFIPLSIGFFDRNKSLVDVQEMEPVRSEMETPKSYQSRYPAQYVLEMPSGWFKQNKIPLGAKISW